MNNPIPMMELDRTENALRDVLIKPLIIPDKNGLLQVPTKPGLGIEVDEIAQHRHLCLDGAASLLAAKLFAPPASSRRATRRAMRNSTVST